MRLDPHVIRLQIANLRAAHPELIEDDESWLLAIESETDLDTILTKIVRQIEDAKALSNGTLERLEDLKARKDRFARRVENLRALAMKMLEAANVNKIELSEATLSVRNVPPSVVITDEENLPDIACKFTRTPDKTKIKELLTTGPVAGATMGNGGKSISIRIK